MPAFRKVVLYTDRDGRAKFREEDVTLSEGTPQAMLSAVLPASGYQLRHSPVGFRSQWHCTPKAQWVFILEGEMEIGLQDGSSRLFKPGEHFYAVGYAPGGGELRRQGAWTLERAARRKPAGDAVRQDLTGSARSGTRPPCANRPLRCINHNRRRPTLATPPHRQTRMSTTAIGVYPEAVLPRGIRSRFVRDVNGLLMHVLEAGFETKGRPCVLLLHGFPELAYSWRKVMLPIAAAGFHVIAPDQRGYGRTTGWDGDYDGDVGSFRILNLVRDALALVSAFGYREVAAVVGHDFGSPVAAYCALVRPDVFRAVALMSAPFAGPPPLPFGTVDEVGARAPAPTIHAELAALARPRKHYQWYYSTREADRDMRDCPQGVHAFLRAYYHHKSADWSQNKPFRLAAWSAGDLAKLPTYYVMNLDQGMAETVAAEMPSASEIAACAWLPEDELRVYSAEYDRTGFQGGSAVVPVRYEHPPRRRAAALLRPHDRRAVVLHRRQERLGRPTRSRATSSGCRRAPARGCSAVIWWMAPGTGCSRSSRRS